MRAIALSLLLFSTAAWGYGTSIDLGDLNIDTNKIPNWTVPTLPDTSGWTIIDLTDSDDMTAIGCGSDLAIPDDSNSDDDAIECAVSGADPNVILYLPSGTYDFTAGDNGISFESNQVLRCESAASTSLAFSGTGENNENGKLEFSGTTPSGGISITSGTAKGSTTLTLSDASSFSVDDWVIVSMDGSTACKYIDVVQGSNEDQYFAFPVQITAKPGGNQVTISSPLRINYDCASPTLYHFTPIQNAGVENCTIEHTSPDTVGYGCVMVGFKHANNVWFTGNDSDGSGSTSLWVWSSSNVLISGNTFQDGGNSGTFNSQGLQIRYGGNNIIIENNIFTNNRVHTESQLGASGVVRAYNYLHESAGGRPHERSVFFHGNYANSSLVEGNASRGAFKIDNYWGRSGEDIVIFRNRLFPYVGGWKTGMGTYLYNHDQDNRPNEYQSWIGNKGVGMHLATGALDVCEPGVGNFDYIAGEDLWLERNLMTDCIKLAPKSTVSCGTNDPNEPICPGTNLIAEDPNGAWDGEKIPHSLYRDSDTPPDWWCEEACDWTDVHNSIGAWGDEGDDPNTMCDIPAQIRYEAGTCTPVSSDPDYEGMPGINFSGLDRQWMDETRELQ